MADSLFAAIRDALAADPRTAGMDPTQGLGKPRPATLYAVGKLKSWVPSYQSSTSTWYDARVELRVHAPTPEAAESAASLAQDVLGSLALDWSIGGTGPPLNITRRGEPIKGYVAGADFQAVHCLEVLYKATGMPGAEPGDAPSIGAPAAGQDDATAFDAGGFDDPADDPTAPAPSAYDAGSPPYGVGSTPPPAAGFNDPSGFDVGGYDDPAAAAPGTPAPAPGAVGVPAFDGSSFDDSTFDTRP